MTNKNDIPMQLSEGLFSGSQKRETSPIRKALQKAANQVVKDTIAHFETDGWDLNYDIITEDVFYNAFGCQLESFLFSAIAKYEDQVNFNLVFRQSDQKFMLVTKTKQANKKVSRTSRPKKKAARKLKKTVKAPELLRINKLKGG
jgi:hypothetical protein